jgi:hypothetical protein
MRAIFLSDKSTIYLNRFAWAILIICILGLQNLPAGAQVVPPAIPAPTSAMRFYLANSGGNCDNCTFVAAVGRITSETARDFQRFIALAPGQGRGMAVYLHSPGGSLLGGIELGRQFRALAMNTAVGHPIPVRNSGDTVSYFQFTAGAECMSACVFAFAGGVKRTHEPDGRRGAAWALHEGRRQTIGVHQFYRAPAQEDTGVSGGSALRSDVESYDQGIADAQKISGVLVSYLADMGVQARLLELTARANPDTFRPLSRSESFATGLANDPAPQSPWTIIPSGGGLALRTTMHSAENSVVAEIACDRSMPERLSAQLAVNIDMRHLGKSVQDINAVLRDNVSGATWVSAPLTPSIEWPAQTRQFRWDGSRLLIEVTLPRPALAHLASGGMINLSLDLPFFLRRGLTDISISAPEIADTQPILLRNCPQR